MEDHRVSDRRPVCIERHVLVAHGVGLAEVVGLGTGGRGRPAVEDIAVAPHALGVGHARELEGVAGLVQGSRGRHVHAATFGVVGVVGVVGQGVAHHGPDGVEVDGLALHVGQRRRNQIAVAVDGGLRGGRDVPAGEDVPVAAHADRLDEVEVLAVGGVLHGQDRRALVQPLAQVVGHVVYDGVEAGVPGGAREPDGVGVLGRGEAGLVAHLLAGGVEPADELVACRGRRSRPEGSSIACGNGLGVGLHLAQARADRIVEGGLLVGEPGIQAQAGGCLVGQVVEACQLGEAGALVHTVVAEVVLVEVGVPIPTQEDRADLARVGFRHDVVGVPGHIGARVHVRALARLVGHAVEALGPAGVEGRVLREGRPRAAGIGHRAVRGQRPAVEAPAGPRHGIRAAHRVGGRADRVGREGLPVLQGGVCRGPAAGDGALGIREGVGHPHAAPPLRREDDALVGDGDIHALCEVARGVQPAGEGPGHAVRARLTCGQCRLTLRPRACKRHRIARLQRGEIGADLAVAPVALLTRQEGHEEQRGPFGSELGVAQDLDQGGVGRVAGGDDLAVSRGRVGPDVEGIGGVDRGQLDVHARGGEHLAIAGRDLCGGRDRTQRRVARLEGDLVGLGLPLGVEDDVGARLGGQVDHGGAVGVDRARAVHLGVPATELHARAAERVGRERLGGVVGHGLARHGPLDVRETSREAHGVGDRFPVGVEGRGAAGHGEVAAGGVGGVALGQGRPAVQLVTGAQEGGGGGQTDGAVGVVGEDERRVVALGGGIGRVGVEAAAVAGHDEVDLAHDPVGVEGHLAARGAREVLDQLVVAVELARAVGAGGPAVEGVAGADDAALALGVGQVLGDVVGEGHVVQVARAAVCVEAHGEVVRLEDRVVDGGAVLGPPGGVDARGRVVGRLGGTPEGLVPDLGARGIGPVEELIAVASNRGGALRLALGRSDDVLEAVDEAARRGGSVDGYGHIPDVAVVLVPPGVDGALGTGGLVGAERAELRGVGHLGGARRSAHVPAHEGVAGLGGIGHAGKQVILGPGDDTACDRGASLGVEDQGVAVLLPDGVEGGVLREHLDLAARHPLGSTGGARAPACQRVARAGHVALAREGDVRALGGRLHAKGRALRGAAVGVEGQLLQALLVDGIKGEVGADRLGQRVKYLAVLGQAPADELPAGLGRGVLVVARVGVERVHIGVAGRVGGREGALSGQVGIAADARPIGRTLDLVEGTVRAGGVAHHIGGRVNKDGRKGGVAHDGELSRVVRDARLGRGALPHRVGPVGQPVAAAFGIRPGYGLVGRERLARPDGVGAHGLDAAVRAGFEAYLAAGSRPSGVEDNGRTIG